MTKAFIEKHKKELFYASMENSVAIEAIPVSALEGYAILKIEDLRNLTFSFDSRSKLEAMLAASEGE